VAAARLDQPALGGLDAVPLLGFCLFMRSPGSHVSAYRVSPFQNASTQGEIVSAMKYGGGAGLLIGGSLVTKGPALVESVFGWPVGPLSGTAFLNVVLVSICTGAASGVLLEMLSKRGKPPRVFRRRSV
jgi:hypothetical protein